MTQQAGNFGVELSTLMGPKDFDDLSESDRRGHELATVYLSHIVDKASMDLLIAVKALREQAEKDKLEINASSYSLGIYMPLTEAELQKRLECEQQAWAAGLLQYLWIAADISNAQPEEAQWKPEGTKARKFQTISGRLGYKLTPFWDFEYTILTGWEKPQSPEDLYVEMFKSDTAFKGLTA